MKLGKTLLLAAAFVAATVAFASDGFMVASRMWRASIPPAVIIGTANVVPFKANSPTRDVCEATCLVSMDGRGRLAFDGCILEASNIELFARLCGFTVYREDADAGETLYGKWRGRP